MKLSSETSVLKSIQLKIAILVGLATPVVAVAGAFYGLKIQMEEKDRQVSDRIGLVELNNEKNFADKSSLKELQQELRATHDDVITIKAMLQHLKR